MSSGEKNSDPSDAFFQVELFNWFPCDSLVELFNWFPCDSELYCTTFD